MSLRRKAGVRRSRLNLVQALESRLLLTIDIQFDYTTLGSSAFFTAERRAALDAAASIFERRITDNLAAIPVSDGEFNRWQPSIPGAQSGSRDLPARSIPANTIVIYVGAANYSGGIAGRGGPGIRINSFEVTSNNTITQRGVDWIELLLHRGKATNEFSTWGGAIYFDSSDRDWYAGTNAAGIGSGQTDLIATAQHEIGHVLGFVEVNLYSAIRTANPGLNMGALANRQYGWEVYANGTQFSGPRSRTAWDGSGNVPISGDHWSDSITSDGVETAMDSSGELGSSERKAFTSLDWAGLDDIGWTIDYPPALTFTVNGSASAPVTETDANLTIPAVIRRSTVSGSLSGNLVVNLSSSNSGVVSVPPTVTIPNNQASATFNLTVRPDADFDDEIATITASSAVATNGLQLIEVRVTDDEVPELTWVISPTTVNETSGSISNVRITRTGPTSATPTPVTLLSPDVTELSFDGASTLTVTIPANSSSSETFAITVEDDDIFDGEKTVQLRASATGFANVLQPVIVRDNELPTLTVTAPARLAEGSDFVDVTVARNTTTGVANVTLTADPATEIDFADATLQIPDGESSVVYRLRARDDSAFDGTVDVVLTASASGHNSGTRSLTTTDNEQPVLGLSISPATFSEAAGNGAATATVTRTGPTDLLRVVTVTTSNPGKVVPESTTVTIPVGSPSATFALNAVDDSVFREVANRSTVITVSAAWAANDAEAAATTTDDEQASPIDFDQDGSFTATNDGILAIRYMAGFRDTDLVDAAVNPDGDRTSAAAITAGLENLATLDVDGNGTVSTLEDGILLIRYYAGFTGDALIDGAIGAGATRAAAAEITSFLDVERNNTPGPLPTGTAAASTTGFERQAASEVEIDFQTATVVVVDQSETTSSVAVDDAENTAFEFPGSRPDRDIADSTVDVPDELDQVFGLPALLGDILAGS